jgi:nitrilase
MRNSCLVFDRSGKIAARYDKIHLFRFQKGVESYDEAREIEAGTTPVAFDLEGWRVALAVCYDLRFPELFRVGAPVDAIVLPAAFTHTTGQAHWEVLLRARAIENLCYVAASAQGGRHESSRRTWGHSMVIDPWGTVQALYAEGAGWVIAEWRREVLETVRAQLPALSHRVL